MDGNRLQSLTSYWQLFQRADNIQTSVAHIRTNLLPELSEQARSEAVIGSVGYQVGQTLTDGADGYLQCG